MQPNTRTSYTEDEIEEIILLLPELGMDRARSFLNVDRKAFEQAWKTHSNKPIPVVPSESLHLPKTYQIQMSITVTTVAWENIPLLLENQWDVELYSDANQQAIMSKFGAHELDQDTELPVGLEPKKGSPIVEKPKPDVVRPPMHKR